MLLDACQLVIFSSEREDPQGWTKQNAWVILIGSLCWETRFDLRRLMGFYQKLQKNKAMKKSQSFGIWVFLLLYSRYIFCTPVLQKSVSHSNFPLCLRENQLHASSTSFKTLLSLFAFKHFAGISAPFIVPSNRVCFQLLRVSPEIFENLHHCKTSWCYCIYSIFVHSNLQSGFESTDTRDSVPAAELLVRTRTSIFVHHSSIKTMGLAMSWDCCLFGVFYLIKASKFQWENFISPTSQHFV